MTARTVKVAVFALAVIAAVIIAAAGCASTPGPQQLAGRCVPSSAGSLAQLLLPTEPAQQARGRLTMCLHIKDITGFTTAFQADLGAVADAGGLGDPAKIQRFREVTVPGLVQRYGS